MSGLLASFDSRRSRRTFDSGQEALVMRKCSCHAGAKCGCDSRDDKSELKSSGLASAQRRGTLDPTVSRGRTIDPRSQDEGEGSREGALGARLRHDFANVRTHSDRRIAISSATALAPAGGAVSLNATPEDDPIHKPLIDDFRKRQGEQPGKSPGAGSDGQLKHSGLLVCPLSTSLDSTTDITAAALAAGYLTAGGILTRIKVGPDTKNWDGSYVFETNKTTKSDCPAEFGTKPCSGDSHFPIGEGHRFRFGGKLPPVHHQFYDVHETFWKGGSLLHDKTRNPKGLSTCQSVCEQQYHCGDLTIGKFAVSRVFRMAKQGVKDVTVIDVTKTKLT
ncbi:MAG TPA: hypothetical protein VJX67_14975 [Blastocatellia bacterium]|nr:hypothetical protein [Blastocatellia bacterium]